jgi:hypothetical protein
MSHMIEAELTPGLSPQEVIQLATPVGGVGFDCLGIAHVGAVVSWLF